MRSNKICFSWECLLVFLFVAIQCCAKKEDIWKGSIETNNGVTVVKNPATPQYHKSIVELQEDFTIQESDPDGKYQLVNPSDLLLDEKKNLYVLDIRDENIKVFDEHGRFLQIIGRKGVGPGELDRPGFFDIINNELAVYCSQNRRLIFFDLEGNYQRTQYSTGWLGQIKMDSKGNIFSICLIGGEGDTKDQKYELQKYDPGLNYLKTFAFRKWTFPYSFSSGASFAISKDDFIIFANPDSYEFKVFDNEGNLRRVIRKKHNPLRIPQEEIEAVSKSRAYKLFGGPEMPKYFAPFYNLKLDEKGRLIVKTHFRSVTNKEWTCDIFSPEGKFLTTIKLRYHHNSLWANSRLYAIEEDKDGEPIVKVYRVTWKNN